MGFGLLYTALYAVTWYSHHILDNRTGFFLSPTCILEFDILATFSYYGFWYLIDLCYRFIVLHRRLWYCTTSRAFFGEESSNLLLSFDLICWLVGCRLSTYHASSLSSGACLILLIISLSCYCLDFKFLLIYVRVRLFFKPHISPHVRG